MLDINLLTKQLGQRADLSPEQVGEAIAALVDQDVPATAKAEFLTALAQKGETVQEIAVFAATLRDQALTPPVDAVTRGRDLVDVVGTGGDRTATINVSTAAALVAAAGGACVAKHGNRAVTSQAGSADVLEALGIPITLEPDQAARVLKEQGFVFLFAPKYHPAFKHIAPARKLCAERGQRTIFNFLGPLLNPARPAVQLTGVSRPELCEPLAHVLQSLGLRRGMVVCGRAPASAAGAGPTESVFLDELSTLGENTIVDIHHHCGFAGTVQPPSSLPLQPGSLADLAGGSPAANAETIRRVFDGKERGPKRDAVLFNAGAALFLAGKAGSVTEGWHVAAAIVDTGKAAEKLRQLSAGR